MLRGTFGVSAVLATVGMVMAIAGMHGNDYTTLPTGLVLLLGAGVFAILSLSARRADRSPAESAGEPESRG